MSVNKVFGFVEARCRFYKEFESVEARCRFTKSSGPLRRGISLQSVRVSSPGSLSVLITSTKTSH